jgi:hypothetical protein
MDREIDAMISTIANALKKTTTLTALDALWACAPANGARPRGAFQKALAEVEVYRDLIPADAMRWLESQADREYHEENSAAVIGAPLHTAPASDPSEDRARIERMIETIKPFLDFNAVNALYICRDGIKNQSPTDTPFRNAVKALGMHQRYIDSEDWAWLEEKAKQEPSDLPQIFAWIGGRVRPNQIAELVTVASANFDISIEMVEQAIRERTQLTLTGPTAHGEAAGLRSFCVENDIDFHIHTNWPSDNMFFHFTTGIGREVVGSALKSGLPDMGPRLLKQFADQGIEMAEAAEILQRLGHVGIHPLTVDHGKPVGNPAFPTEEQAIAVVMGSLLRTLEWLREIPSDRLETLREEMGRSAPTADIENSLAIVRRAGWMHELK